MPIKPSRGSKTGRITARDAAKRKPLFANLTRPWMGEDKDNQIKAGLSVYSSGVAFGFKKRF